MTAHYLCHAGDLVHRFLFTEKSFYNLSLSLSPHCSVIDPVMANHMSSIEI
ncbi:unnamed protein product [Brassica oleracea]